MAHTPGPWHIDENGSSISSDAVTDLALLNMVNVRFSWGGSDFATKSHRMANARLISAAPDLLEALKKMLDVWEHGGIATYPIGEARAAIKKAESTP